MTKRDIIPLIAFGIIVFIAVSGALKLTQAPATPEVVGSAYDDLYGNCIVTERVVSVGHQAATQVLATSTSRQWAIIQQPINATNTPTIAFSGLAVSARAFQLSTSSPTGIPQFAFGLGTDIKTGNAVSVRTDSGTTTVKVIQCDGRTRNR